MRTPRMNQDGSQGAAVNGLQPNSQDRSTFRRARSNSGRDQIGSDSEDRKSRASSIAQSDLSSDTARYNKARVPVNEAVHSVLDPIDPTHTAIPPEVLNQITSQITANVLKQLQANQSSPTTHTSSNMTQHGDSTSSAGGSPPIDRDKVYTPPSPYRGSEDAARSGSPSSPRKQPKFQTFSDPRRPPTPPFSHGTLSEDSDAKEGANVRPRAERSSTGGDTTVVEKIWGFLFDENGQPTPRLGQFLRGIAVHLIEDYEPKHSLVVTPDKMQKYYEETKLTTEIYPWQIIFDDRTSSISRLFREIEVQHHLVQDKPNERPDIPGMTPFGFETWMTLVLKAHPDEEFERLAYTALHMPVSNPDDKKERFPKELSRRQFPKDGDGPAARKLQRIAYTHCGVKIPSRNGSISQSENKPANATTRTQDTGPSSNPSSYRAPPYEIPLSQTTTRSSIPDVDRNVLRPTVSEVAAEESPIEILPPAPIERERKPYVAQPGGGKHHDNIDAPIIQPADSRFNQSGPPPPVKLTRSASMSSSRPIDPRLRPTQPIAIHQRPGQMQPPPVDIPPPSRPRNSGQYYRDGQKRDGRNRSPSITRNNDVPHRSDGDVAYGYPSGSADFTPTTPTTRRPENRHDRRGSISNEQRDWERDPRQRYNSVSTSDGYRYHPSKDHPSEDEYHRHSNGGYAGSDLQHTTSHQYPPNAYRNWP